MYFVEALGVHCPVAVPCGMCLPLPQSSWVSLCSVGSSELRLLKTQINSTALLLSCSLHCWPSRHWWWLQFGNIAIISAAGGQKGLSRIPLVPVLSPMRKGPLLCGPSASPQIPETRYMKMFLLRRDFLVPSHAGFVKLCSW